MNDHAFSPVRRFYATDLTPCPYIEGRFERRLVTAPRNPQDEAGLDALTLAGFRRSQNFLYKPACPGCVSCVPVRIVVGRFVPDRTQRKLLKRNGGIVATRGPARATEEQFDLFRRYLRRRHGDGGMVRMSREDYGQMVERCPTATILVEFRDPDGTLVAVSLTDRLRSGLSGVYKFFETAEPRRSLGTYVILWHIEEARALGLPYVYLGYWIAESRKMAYKQRFGPLERLAGWQWVPLEDEAGSVEEQAG